MRKAVEQATVPGAPLRAEDDALQERRRKALADPRFRRWLAEADAKVWAWERSYTFDSGRRRNKFDG